MEFATNDKPVNLLDAVAEARPKMAISFFAPITDLAAAKAWIEALHNAGMMFHFEDSPETIINGKTGAPLFSVGQIKAVRQRVAELYALDWSEAGHECPIGYALEVMGHVWE